MNKLIVEYVWLDGHGELRSRTRILPAGNYSIENIPIWDFDGQAPAQKSDMILRPIQLYRNPFHKPGFLVLCEIYFIDDSGKLCATANNERYQALRYFQLDEYSEPMFGIEQSYYILNADGELYKAKEQEMYGTVGVEGRSLAEAHLDACLYAGLDIITINAAAGPGQWVYQLGPLPGITAADQLWMARYIMQRVAEQSKVIISYQPQPIGDDLPGSGAHVTFSSIQMRLPKGYLAITEAITKLEGTHTDYIQNCGEYTSKRLIGEHGTSLFDHFSWGIGSRDTSIRIPTDTFNKKSGYFEDRRPSANMNPYKICGMIMNTCTS